MFGMRLSVALLFFQGVHEIMSSSIFVSHHGDDLINCGNWTAPCRSIRRAVEICNDGDEIHIDHAQGRPYMECENVTQSKCSITLAKSISFHGYNGTADIRCRKTCNFFTIRSLRLNVTRVHFVNLIVSRSSIVTKFDTGTRSELGFHNSIVKENDIVMNGKLLTDCFIKIVNSSFIHNSNGAINIRQCLNISADISSSIFKGNILFLENSANKPARLQNTKIFVRDTVFDGGNIRKCIVLNLLAVKPFSSVLNVTIINSKFGNHVTICPTKNELSVLEIDDHASKVRNITFVHLSNILFENNDNNWATLSLTAGYLKYSSVNIAIRNSIFRNNSGPLRVRTFPLDRYTSSLRHSPTIFLENNTFVNNIYKLFKPNGAAAIYLERCKARLSFCRFLDNKVRPSLYTGVVTVDETAIVTFSDSHFENKQTSVHANQFFTTGQNPVYFIGYNTFNMVALNEPQSVFLRIPTALSVGALIKKHFKILCPQGYKLVLQKECERSKNKKIFKNTWNCFYINVQCELCPTKTYTVERGSLVYNKSNNIQCKPCPRGGDCNSGRVTAKPSFWGLKIKKKVFFFQCPPGYCCESENCVTYDGCYGNRSGTLCGRCPKGMAESLFSTQCISNTKCSISELFVLAVITMLALYLVFFLYHKEISSFLKASLFAKGLSFSTSFGNDQRNNATNSNKTSSANGMIKIFFYYYQVCHLLRSSVGPLKKGQFSVSFENFISRLMNMVIVNIPSFNCPLMDLRVVPKTVIQHSVGYCLLGLVCCLYLVNRIFKILKKLRRRSYAGPASQNISTISSFQESSVSKLSFSQRVTSAFTYISLLMYASSTQLCLSLLHCVPIGDTQVLFLDGNIQCYQIFQYILLAYIFFSILPFCLVPVLGSYLLKSGRIGVKQFCVACIFPLPFCCFWFYLLLKDYHKGSRRTYSSIEDTLTQDRGNGGTEDRVSILGTGETISFRKSNTAILSVLLGPFRPHKSFLCFPSSRVPWEGFLIFRRLILIIVLTFVYDIKLRLFLASTLCVAILLSHMFVKPFQRRFDNTLESLSLAAHAVLCCLTLNKALYYGEDLSSFSNSLSLLNVIENILVIAPLSVIMLVVILCVVRKLVFGLIFFLVFMVQKVRGS